MVDFWTFIWISIIAPILLLIAILVGILILKWRSDAKTLDIFRDKGIWPSLSRFQATLWTLVFAFTILSIFFIDSFTDVSTLPSDTAPSYTTTLLVGALTAVAFGNGLSERKYQEYYTTTLNPRNQDTVPATKEDKDKADAVFRAAVAAAQASGSLAPARPSPTSTPLVKDTPRKFITMLMEHGKLSITRVQLFMWTWIALFVYLLTFFLELGYAYYNQTTASIFLPNIDSNLLALSGISMAGFVVGKAVVGKAGYSEANDPPKPELFTKTSKL